MVSNEGSYICKAKSSAGEIEEVLQIIVSEDSNIIEDVSTKYIILELWNFNNGWKKIIILFSKKHKLRENCCTHFVNTMNDKIKIGLSFRKYVLSVSKVKLKQNTYQ